MLLSLSGFLFEDDYRTQSLSFREFCHLARDAGYDAVDLRRTQVSPDTAESERYDVAAVLADEGLRVSMLTARGLPESGDERDRAFYAYLDLCNALGCTLLKISSDTDWLASAVERAREQSVTLATNNHINSPLETVSGTREYLERIGDTRMALLYDPQHLFVAGEDYLGCIDEFAFRIVAVLTHRVSTVRHYESPPEPRFEHGGREWYLSRPDRSDVQDWHAIMEKFADRGVGPTVTVFENGWPADQREQIARERAAYFGRLWRSVT